MSRVQLSQGRGELGAACVRSLQPLFPPCCDGMGGVLVELQVLLVRSHAKLVCEGDDFDFVHRPFEHVNRACPPPLLDGSSLEEPKVNAESVGAREFKLGGRGGRTVSGALDGVALRSTFFDVEEWIYDVCMARTIIPPEHLVLGPWLCYTRVRSHFHRSVTGRNSVRLLTRPGSN